MGPLAANGSGQGPAGTLALDSSPWVNAVVGIHSTSSSNTLYLSVAYPHLCPRGW